MEYASVSGFEAHPSKVLAWYESRRSGAHDALPNDAHHALAAQTSMTHITQNVDSLLEAAGATDVVHLHGTIDRDRCHNQCGFTRPWEPGHTTGHVSLCPDCGGMLRPAVVWFGETLSTEALIRAETACRGADVLLVIGTSASTWPAAGLIDLAEEATVITVNLEHQDGHIPIVGLAGDVLPQLF